MPCHLMAPARHHCADLSRRPVSEVLSDVAVRHHLAARDQLDDIEDLPRERRQLGYGHGLRLQPYNDFVCCIITGASPSDRHEYSWL